jgi:hypothetical protein
MAYAQADIARAAKRQRAVAAARPVARPVGDGELTMQVDPVLFHNARISNERVYGVDNVWEHQEFCDDMSRRHPELRVRSASGRIFVGGRGSGCGGVGRLTRLGRVTFHKRYGGG